MIQREPLGGATLVRFAHRKANALDLEFLREIQRTLVALEPEGRPLVLTGTGAIFGAGRGPQAADRRRRRLCA